MTWQRGIRQSLRHGRDRRRAGLQERLHRGALYQGAHQGGGAVQVEHRLNPGYAAHLGDPRAADPTLEPKV